MENKLKKIFEYIRYIQDNYASFSPEEKEITVKEIQKFNERLKSKLKK
jgi:hypothetical protein